MLGKHGNQKGPTQPMPPSQEISPYSEMIKGQLGVPLDLPPASPPKGRSQHAGDQEGHRQPTEEVP